MGGRNNKDSQISWVIPIGGPENATSPPLIEVTEVTAASQITYTASYYDSAGANRRGYQLFNPAASTHNVLISKVAVLSGANDGVWFALQTGKFAGVSEVNRSVSIVKHDLSNPTAQAQFWESENIIASGSLLRCPSNVWVDVNYFKGFILAPNEAMGFNTESAGTLLGLLFEWEEIPTT